MSLKETLLENLKTAMKNNDTIRKNVIQLIRAAILQSEKDNRVVLDDDKVVEIIGKELKKRKDALPEYEKSGRLVLIENLKTEMDILSAYLPEQLNEKELEDLITKVIEENGINSPKEIGKVMKLVLPQVKGRADGKVINMMANRILEQKSV